MKPLKLFYLLTLSLLLFGCEKEETSDCEDYKYEFSVEFVNNSKFDKNFTGVFLTSIQGSYFGTINDDPCAETIKIASTGENWGSITVSGNGSYSERLLHHFPGQQMSFEFPNSQVVSIGHNDVLKVIYDEIDGDDQYIVIKNPTSTEGGGTGDDDGDEGGGNTGQTVQVQFVLTGYSGYNADQTSCILPITVAVHDFGTFYYCQADDNNCRACGSSFSSFYGGSGQSYGQEIVTLATNNNIACGASGAAIFNLPPGRYSFEWESPVCVKNSFFNTNTKSFHGGGNFYIYSYHLQEECVNFSIHKNDSKTECLNWLQANCI